MIPEVFWHKDWRLSRNGFSVELFRLTCPTSREEDIRGKVVFFFGIGWGLPVERFDNRRWFRLYIGIPGRRLEFSQKRVAVGFEFPIQFWRENTALSDQ